MWWRRQWQPTLVLLPGKSHEQRSLVGCSPWGQGVGQDWATSLSLFTVMHWRRKWQPTPVFLRGESQGRGSLGGLPSMGSYRLRHDWSDLAAAAAAAAAEAGNNLLALFSGGLLVGTWYSKLTVNSVLGNTSTLAFFQAIFKECAYCLPDFLKIQFVECGILKGCCMKIFTDILWKVWKFGVWFYFFLGLEFKSNLGTK